MKAALMYRGGDGPHYAYFPEPVVRSEDELLITVRAAAIKHLDKSRASGKHYSTSGDISSAKVIGGDGVGLLRDGRRVYAIGADGMLAEEALIEKDRMVPLPDGIDDAAAQPWRCASGRP